MSTVNTVTEQLTRAGQAIEHDSFAIIDAEVQGHSYTPEQWPIVRRMIHANADFDFNGLTDFHPQAVQAGIRAMLRGGTPVVADVEMICSGLSVPRLAHFGMVTHQFISDADVIAQAQAENTTRAVQAMRKAHRLGLLEGAIVGIGNAPTALIELARLIAEEGVRPALCAGWRSGLWTRPPTHSAVDGDPGAQGRLDLGGGRTACAAGPGRGAAEANDGARLTPP